MESEAGATLAAAGWHKVGLHVYEKAVRDHRFEIRTGKGVTFSVLMEGEYCRLAFGTKGLIRRHVLRGLQNNLRQNVLIDLQECTLEALPSD